MPTFHVLDFGSSQRVADQLLASGEAALNAESVMTEIGLDMMRVEKILFSSQGRRGGGSWKPLKPDTIRKKGTTEILRTEGARPGYSPGDHGPDSLFRSLTEPGADFQIFNVTPSTIQFGTERPFAEVHQRGAPSRGIPARPVLRFLPGDVARWETWLLRHIVRPISA